MVHLVYRLGKPTRGRAAELKGFAGFFDSLEFSGHFTFSFLMLEYWTMNHVSTTIYDGNPKPGAALRPPYTHDLKKKDLKNKKWT